MRAIAAVVAVVLAGCATPNTSNLPLMFGESLTFGVSLGSSAAEQGLDMTVGFKSRDIALVPVVGPKGEAIASTVEGKSGGKTADAYSVLGQFQSTSDGKSAKVGLGKFFATGTAAATLADGFAKSMGGDGTSSAQAEANDAKTASARKPGQ